MPCDVSSSFPPSPNQAEIPVVAFFITLVGLVRKLVPTRSYDGASEKKPQGGLCSYLPGATRELSRRNVERRVLSAPRPSHTIRVFSVTVGQ
jgi:hypothetical protein